MREATDHSVQVRKGGLGKVFLAQMIPHSTALMNRASQQNSDRTPLVGA